MNLLGKKNNYDLWEFESVRSYLISNSAGFRLIVDKLKRKYQLENLSPLDQKNMLLKASFGADPKLKDDLKTISKKFNLNTEEILEDLISGWIEHKGFNYVSLPIHIATGEPFDDGFYIKVDPHTRLQTIKKSYEYIQFLWEDLAKNAESSPKIVISRRDKPISDLNKKIYTFLLIESYLYKHYYNREKSYQGAKTEMLNNERKANPFIEKAFLYAMDALKLSDKEHSHVVDNYYTMLEYYSIPPLHKFKKLLIKPL